MDDEAGVSDGKLGWGHGAILPCAALALPPGSVDLCHLPACVCRSRGSCVIQRTPFISFRTGFTASSSATPRTIAAIPRLEKYGTSLRGS